jgi:RNA polymerase sigma-70 factor (ECF subfamily)
LRRRKRRAYIGPWLPTPIETGDDTPSSYEPTVEGETLEGRYDLMESVSLAFLQALEALSPTQRAVLILRDVFDYSAAEVATALDTSEGNVRTIHHRARRAMDAYERHRAIPTSRNRARTEKALHQFLSLLGSGDVGGIERMLAADIKTVTDGGGEFTAILKPISGVGRVAQFFARLAASRTDTLNVALRAINEFPALLIEFEATPEAEARRAPHRRPPRIVISVDLDDAGLISIVRVFASSTKLKTVGPVTPPVPA